MTDAKELFLSDGKSAGVWYCSGCRIVTKTAEKAESCCRPYKCSVCGCETPRYRTKCDNCREAETKARDDERMANAELVSEYDGWVFSPQVYGHQDGYFQSVDDLLDYCGDEEIEPPEFVHCCKAVPIRVTIEDVTSRLDDEGWEGMLDHVSGMKELEEAIERFNAINADVCVTYQCDGKRKVRVAISTTGEPSQ